MAKETMTVEERKQTIHRMLEAVYKFIKESGYLENPHVLGFALYGSYTTGYWHSGSDVDMHIIMDNTVSPKDIYRGSKEVDGFNIEFFEKPINIIKNGVDIDFITNENAYLTMIGLGKILCNRRGKIKKLQDYIIKKYSEPQPPLSGDDAIEAAAIIKNKMDELKKMLICHSDMYDMYYYRVLDSIRKFYSRLCGCPNVPPDKVERIYTDPEYAIVFCKKNIPDDKFVNDFFAAAKSKETKQEKFERLQDLFNYTIRNLNFDPKNYRIRIKDRHGPYCVTHTFIKY